MAGAIVTDSSRRSRALIMRVTITQIALASFFLSPWLPPLRGRRLATVHAWLSDSVNPRQTGCVRPLDTL